MINKEKFRLVNKITISIILFFILLLFMGKVFSAFQTDGKGEVINDVAFYVLEAKGQSEELKMFEVSPDGNDYLYNIDVSNFKDDKVCETDMEYDFTLVTTTNLPVNYSLYLDGENVITNKEVYQDEYGTYFYKFHTSLKNFTHDVKRTDSYELVINFPLEYSSFEYQDLLDSVSVYIDSRQV